MLLVRLLSYSVMGQRTPLFFFLCTLFAEMQTIILYQLRGKSLLVALANTTSADPDVASHCQSAH